MHVKIEVHYDNTLAVAGAQDQSGTRLALTPDPRPLESSIDSMIVGMATRDGNFSIPANTDDCIIENICPSEATSQLTHPLFIYQFTPHINLPPISFVSSNFDNREILTESIICDFETNPTKNGSDSTNPGDTGIDTSGSGLFIPGLFLAISMLTAMLV